MQQTNAKLPCVWIDRRHICVCMCMCDTVSWSLSLRTLNVELHLHTRNHSGQASTLVHRKAWLRAMPCNEMEIASPHHVQKEVIWSYIEVTIFHVSGWILIIHDFSITLKQVILNHFDSFWVLPTQPPLGVIIQIFAYLKNLKKKTPAWSLERCRYQRPPNGGNGLWSHRSGGHTWWQGPVWNWHLGHQRRRDTWRDMARLGSF